MTHTATRYTRTPVDHAHSLYLCPDRAVTPHYLIPLSAEGGGVFVCPYDYDVELSHAYQERQERERAAERERIAQEIAAEQIDTYAAEMCTDAERSEFYRNAEQWRDMIAAAALQALTHAEKES